MHFNDLKKAFLWTQLTTKQSEGSCDDYSNDDYAAHDNVVDENDCPRDTVVVRIVGVVDVNSNPIAQLKWRRYNNPWVMISTSIQPGCATFVAIFIINLVILVFFVIS